MDVTRESLCEKFSAYNDAELLKLYRSGDLTELASDVARGELVKRGLDLTRPPPESEPPYEPEPVIEGDLVVVARLFNVAEADVLRGRLEAEGVPAMVADSHTALYIPTMIGGVRILVPEAYEEKAHEILKADARGDYAIDDRTDVGPPSDNA
jgi:hypothetical protein